jgi:hypothetical protein
VKTTQLGYNIIHLLDGIHDDVRVENVLAADIENAMWIIGFETSEIIE